METHFSKITKSRDKMIIRDNIIRNNKFIKNNLVKNKSKTFFWKIYYKLNNDEDQVMYTTLQCTIEIMKRNKNIILYFKSNMIGLKNYDENENENEIVTINKIVGYNIDDLEYNYKIIQSKYCPSENILITKNKDDLSDLNEGIICYKVSAKANDENVNVMEPNNISMEITKDGEIIIYDCEFITANNQNILMNDYQYLYKP